MFASRAVGSVEYSAASEPFPSPYCGGDRNPTGGVPISAGDGTEARRRETRDLCRGGRPASVIPLAALVFGIIVPRFLDKKVRSVSLSFEWCAVGFAASFFLAQRGTRPTYCILAGLLLAIGICAVISAFHRSYRIRRLFSRKGRRAAILACSRDRASIRTKGQHHAAFSSHSGPSE